MVKQNKTNLLSHLLKDDGVHLGVDFPVMRV